MRHIAALDDDKIPPRDEDFHFRARAKGLVDKWHRILNANKPAGVTSPISAGPGRMNGGGALKEVTKEQLVEAMVATVTHDQQLTLGEAELLRAVCASLHCPLPPLLAS